MAPESEQYQSSDEVLCQELSELLKRTRSGGFFYAFLLSGIVLAETSLWTHSVTKLCLVVLVVATIFRIFLYLHFKTHKNQTAVEKRVRLMLYLLVGLSASAWTLFSTHVLVYRESFDALLSLIYLSTLAVASGTVISMATDLRLVRVIVALLLLPTAVAAQAHTGTIGTVVAIYTLVYMFYLLKQSKMLNQSYWRYIQQNQKLRYQTAELEQVWKKAEAASNTKGRFLSHMSHEIRTPMNGVLGNLELLDQTELDPEQKEQLETIRASGRLLLRILDDVLDYSRLEHEVSPIVNEAVDLRKVVGICVDLLKSMVKLGVELSVVIDEAVPRLVKSDAVRLEQLVFNLVNNALKFTQQGKVEVKLGVVAGGDDETIRVRFSVTDTGVGISEQDQQAIFDQFNKVEFNRSNAKGAGLGLTISKKLVELMKGEIGVSSKLGEGSTFWFELPMSLVQPETALSPHEKAAVFTLVDGEENPLDRKLVLIVEDDPVNQKVAAAFVARLGCSVAMAKDGLEAFEKFRQLTPDVILMDCNMPNMDGFEATRLIRQYEWEKGLPKTPVIALTAHAFNDIVAKCFDCGMDEHMAKPFTLDSLREILERFVDPAKCA